MRRTITIALVGAGVLGYIWYAAVTHVGEARARKALRRGAAR